MILYKSMQLKCVRKNGQIFYLCNNRTISRKKYMILKKQAKPINRRTNTGGSREHAE